MRFARAVSLSMKNEGRPDSSHSETIIFERGLYIKVPSLPEKRLLDAARRGADFTKVSGVALTVFGPTFENWRISKSILLFKIMGNVCRASVNVTPTIVSSPISLLFPMIHGETRSPKKASNKSSILTPRARAHLTTRDEAERGTLIAHCFQIKC